MRDLASIGDTVKAAVVAALQQLLEELLGPSA
jgi:hypothetical protein